VRVFDNATLLGEVDVYLDDEVLDPTPRTILAHGKRASS